MAKTALHESARPNLQALVTGVRADHNVEFSFLYGDPDLAVDLVLPLAAFREFCAENDCRIAVPDDQLRTVMRRLLGAHDLPAFHSPSAPEFRS